ncbi:MAG: hypothetical protein ABI970_05295, partial [Chloroflexota bacterium]
DEIAFQFGQSNTRSLYLLDIHHHLAMQLARGTNPFPNYSWSPDGMAICCSPKQTVSRTQMIVAHRLIT